MNIKTVYIVLTLLISLSVSAQNKFFEDTESDVDSVEYYRKQAQDLFLMDSISKSLFAINKVFELADSIENKKLFGNLYIIKGYIFMNRGSYIKAIESFTIAKKIGEELGIIDMQISGLHGLGRVNINTENYGKAKYYLKLGLLLSEKHNIKRAESIFNNALGILLQSLGNYSKSLLYFQRFYSISTELSDSLSIVYANVNIGESYLSMGLLDSALIYNRRAERLNKTINNAQAKASISGNYGKLAFEKGNYEESIDYINKCMQISFDNNFSLFIVENYYLLIEDYQMLGEVNKAMALYKELDVYKDSIHKVNSIKNINLIQSQLILEEKATKTLYWQQKYRNRNILLALVLSMSLLVIVLVFLLLKRIKENKKKHSEETKSLNIEIDERNRELVTLVMSENQRNIAIDGLTKTIDSISKEADIKIIQHDLNELQKELRRNEQVSGKWESFKVHFEKVHPDFFDTLNKTQINLTQSELRMCAYIKMNLTSKEIANLQNISIRSIQTNRYRLKKKLCLDKNTDLTIFIHEL